MMLFRKRSAKRSVEWFTKWEAMMVLFRGASLPVTAAGFANARQKLAVEDAELWTVVFTETDPPNRAGIWNNRRPQILYEQQHIFHRLTNGALDDPNPGIINRNPGN